MLDRTLVVSWANMRVVLMVEMLDTQMEVQLVGTTVHKMVARMVDTMGEM